MSKTIHCMTEPTDWLSFRPGSTGAVGAIRMSESGHQTEIDLSADGARQLRDWLDEVLDEDSSFETVDSVKTYSINPGDFIRHNGVSYKVHSAGTTGAYGGKHFEVHATEQTQNKPGEFKHGDSIVPVGNSTGWHYEAVEVPGRGWYYAEPDKNHLYPLGHKTDWVKAD